MKRLVTLSAAIALFSAPALAETCQYANAKTASHVEAELVKGDWAEADIVDTAADAGQFNTLLAAAEAAGLVEALKGDGPLTVFAPTDEAFAALPAGTVETLLLPENKDTLAGILKLHVIAGSKIKSDQLAGKTLTAETLNGTVAIDGTDGVTVNGASVVAADVMASNGVIHVIDAVLLPEG
ncbi:MAG: fasciclin domain-containing protein [Pseudomonadota bacterium]|nr:fasciclin domain-containing protein [Pseudomonadota bacterium]